MANYKSIFTGTQIDEAVGRILQATLGTLYQNEDGTHQYITNKTAELGSNDLSFVTAGDKYRWNHMIPDSFLDNAEATKVVTLDENMKVPMERLRTLKEGGVAVLDANNKIPNSQLHVGEAGGLAQLNAEGKVPSSQLPSYVDDVLEFATYNDFPRPGESEKIYVELKHNKTYRWGGTDYVEISASLTLGEKGGTAYPGDQGKLAYDTASEAQTDLTDLKPKVNNTAYPHALAKGNEYGIGLYKIKTNAEGHVTNAISVSKTDIVNLGIPDSKTSVTITDLQTDGLKIATINVDNQSYDLYAKLIDKEILGQNTQMNDGYVLKGQGNPNKVWGTDSEGNPNWREVTASINTTGALVANGWNSTTLEQTINVSGVTATNTILIVPVQSSQEEYDSCKVLCTSQGTSELTFKCSKIPTHALFVNILIIN